VVTGRGPQGGDPDRPAPGLASLVSGLARRHEVHLFVLASDPAEGATSTGVQVHHVGIARGMLGRRSRPHLVRALRAAGPFDVVHVHLGGPASALALAAALALAVPLVVSFQGGQRREGRSAPWRQVLSAVAARIGVRVASATSPVEAVEELYRAAVARRPPTASRTAAEPAMPAEQAYDLWAGTYDQQENNLLLHLDHELTFGDTTAADWRHKKILDFGCGTGRHWRKVQSFGPDLLVGVDISAEMLRKLTESHPGAETYQIRDESLAMFEDGELDVVMSNLTIGYVSDLERLLREWSRVLRSGGNVLVTDLHPAALARGAKRDFTAGGRAIEIQNHAHQPRAIEELARACGLMPVGFAERRVDDTTRAFFERAHARPVFDRMKETPLVYKLRLTKS
jgi:ubiquinone/menaquinone biosynthesis C-methylase UbiE